MANIQQHWNALGNSAISALKNNPSWNEKLGMGTGYGFVGLSAAAGLKSFDAFRNQQYGTAALNAGIAGMAGHYAYTNLMAKATMVSHLSRLFK